MTNGISVIYNPAAGRGRRVRKQWLAVEAALRKSGVDFEAVPTSAPLEAVTLWPDRERKGTRPLLALEGMGRFMRLSMVFFRRQESVKRSLWG